MSEIPKLLTKIRPLDDRVVVMPMKRDQQTKSGLIIPDTVGKDRPEQGTVIALGNGGIKKDSVNPQEHLKVGDTVLFGIYAGDDVKVKDETGKDITIRVMPITSVLGIVE